MVYNTRSGSLDYLQNSASAAPNFINYTGSLTLNQNPYFSLDKWGVLRPQASTSSFIKTETNTITEELTVEYFQRVYDAGTCGYCYYTKTSIDPTPSAGETTPNYTGAISDHSIVKILEIY